MDYELDRGIAVRRVAASARASGAVTTGDEQAYDAVLGAGWVVGGGINGGYALSVIGNAIRESLAAGGADGEDRAGQPDPVSVSGYFVSASRPGPAVVRTRLIRRGGRLSTVAATLFQTDDEADGGEVARITVLATYGDLGNVTGDVRTTLVEPDLPPVEDCVPTTFAPDSFQKTAPLLERFDNRLDPAYLGWASGKPSGTGLIQGWFKLADGRPLDPIALLLVVDALPPASYDLGMPGWAPTLELTVHVRACPAPGWVKVRHRTQNVAGGFFEEDCEVWDSTGRLVAQSRQLALLPRKR